MKIKIIGKENLDFTFFTISFDKKMLINKDKTSLLYNSTIEKLTEIEKASTCLVTVMTDDDIEYYIDREEIEYSKVIEKFFMSLNKFYLLCYENKIDFTELLSKLMMEYDYIEKALEAENCLIVDKEKENFDKKFLEFFVHTQCNKHSKNEEEMKSMIDILFPYININELLYNCLYEDYFVVDMEEEEKKTSVILY